MDYNRVITAVMSRAINKRVVVLTNSDAMTARLTVALAEWCKDRKLKCRDWSDSTIYVPGYHEIAIVHAAEFNMQRRRDFPGEVYTVGDGVITTLENPPTPIEKLLEQVGDIFRLTVSETGEVADFENPIEAKRRYDDYLTDDRTFGDEIEREGFDRYTGKRRS